MRSVELDPDAIDDLAWFIANDRKLASRILRLMSEAARTPFAGTGKPEPLKRELKGFWSRRIDDEHRLIYAVTDVRIHVISCRHHYR